MPTDSRREAKIELGLDQADLDRDIAKARRTVRTFGRDIKRNRFGGSDGPKPSARGRKPEGGAGVMWKSLGAATAAMGITSLLAGGAQDAIEFETALTRLQIAGGMTDEQLGRMREEVKRVSSATGIARVEIMKGASAYTALTGDAKGAAASMALFAEIAAGSGATMDAIAGTAAALTKNLKIDPADFRKAFDVLITQGKLGAVEIADLATKFASLAPQFSQFAGARSVGGMAELGAMLQVARQGFGSADEAGTGFNGMMTQLARNQKKLKKLGIKVIDPQTGKFKNLLQIVREIGANEKIMKPGKLLETLGEEKAVRAMGVLIENLKEVDRIKADSLNSDAVAKDNAKFQASAAGRFAASMNAAKNAFADIFTPERIEAFANTLTGVMETVGGIVDLMSGVGEMLDGIASHPVLQKIGWLAKQLGGGATFDAIERQIQERANPHMQRANREKAMQTLQQMGAAGRGSAGDAFLGGIGVSRGELGAEVARKFVESNKEVVAALKELAKQPVNLNVDGAKVAQKVDNAKRPAPRGRL